MQIYVFMMCNSAYTILLHHVDGHIFGWTEILDCIETLQCTSAMIEVVKTNSPSWTTEKCQECVC